MLCSLLVAVELYVLVYDFDTSGGTRLSAPVVGKLKFIENEVRSKSSGTIAWKLPEHGDALRNQDTLLTMKHSQALVEFQDGSEFLIDQDSLVVLEKQNSGIADRYQKIVLKLKQGTLVKKTAGDAPVAILVKGQTIEDVSGNARFRLSTADGQVKIEVESGELKLDGGKILSSGQTTEIADPSRFTLETLPVGDDNAWVRDVEKEKVRLAWKPPQNLAPEASERAKELRVLVSATPDFKGAREVAVSESAEAEVDLEKDGKYYWRVFTKDDEPVSPPQEFLVATRKPPEVMSDDEIQAIAGKPFALEWKASDRGEILLEISESEDFTTSEKLRVPASNGAIKTKRKLPKTYYWRASLDYGGKIGVSKPSETRKIFVKPKPLLDAPKIRKPKIRLQSDRKLKPGQFSAAEKDGFTLPEPKDRMAVVRLEWDKVEGAVNYQLQIAADEGFTRILLERKTPKRFFQFKSPQKKAIQKFFYRVASIDDDGDPGPYSKAIAFEVAARPVEPSSDDGTPALTPEEIRKKVPWRLEGLAGAGYHNRSFKNDVQNPLSTVGAAFIPAFAAFEFRRWWQSREEDSAEPIDTSEIVVNGWFIIEKAEPTTPNVLVETYGIPVMQVSLAYEWDQWGARLGVGPYAATTHKFSFTGRSAKAERVLLAGAHATLRSSLIDKRAWHWSVQLAVTGMGAIGGEFRAGAKMPWHLKSVQWMAYQGFFGELEAFGRFDKLETAYGADFKIGFGF